MMTRHAKAPRTLDQKFKALAKVRRRKIAADFLSDPQRDRDALFQPIKEELRFRRKPRGRR